MSIRLFQPIKCVHWVDPHSMVVTARYHITCHNSSTFLLLVFSSLVGQGLSRFFLEVTPALL